MEEDNITPEDSENIADSLVKDAIEDGIRLGHIEEISINGEIRYVLTAAGKKYISDRVCGSWFSVGDCGHA